MEENYTKWCPDCKKRIPLNLFGDLKRSKDGKGFYCKFHTNRRSLSFRRRHWDKILKRDKIKRRKNGIPSIHLSRNPFIREGRRAERLVAMRLRVLGFKVERTKTGRGSDLKVTYREKTFTVEVKKASKNSKAESWTVSNLTRRAAKDDFIAVVHEKYFAIYPMKQHLKIKTSYGKSAVTPIVRALQLMKSDMICSTLSRLMRR